jgi:hypothetical protein
MRGGQGLQGGTGGDGGRAPQPGALVPVLPAGARVGAPLANTAATVAQLALSQRPLRTGRLRLLQHLACQQRRAAGGPREAVLTAALLPAVFRDAASPRQVQGCRCCTGTRGRGTPRRLARGVRWRSARPPRLRRHGSVPPQPPAYALAPVHLHPWVSSVRVCKQASKRECATAPRGQARRWTLHKHASSGSCAPRLFAASKGVNRHRPTCHGGTVVSSRHPRDSTCPSLCSRALLCNAWACSSAEASCSSAEPTTHA